MEGGCQWIHRDGGKMLDISETLKWYCGREVGQKSGRIAERILVATVLSLPLPLPHNLSYPSVKNNAAALLSKVDQTLMTEEGILRSPQLDGSQTLPYHEKTSGRSSWRGPSEGIERHICWLKPVAKEAGCLPEAPIHDFMHRLPRLRWPLDHKQSSRILSEGSCWLRITES